MKSIRNGTLFISFILSFFIAVSDILFAFFLGSILESALGLDLALLGKNTKTIIAILILSIALRYIWTQTRSKYIADNISYVRSALTSRFMSEPLKTFNENRTSHYINLLTTNIDLLSSNYYASITLTPYDFFRFILSVASLIYIDASLFFYYLILFLLPVVIPRILDTALGRKLGDLTKANEVLLNETKEIIQNRDEIYVNSVQHHFQKLYNTVSQDQAKKGHTHRILNVFVQDMAEVISAISQVLCMAIGCYLVLEGKLTIGYLATSIQLLNSIFNPIKNLSYKVSLIKSTKELRTSIETLLSETSGTEGSDELFIKKSNDALVIQFKHLSVSFEDQTIIKDINLSLSSGNCYAIVGESGTGKSTLLKSLMKYHEYEGNITINDISASEIPDHELYDLVSYVPQDPIIFNKDVLFNITMGNQYSANQIEDVVAQTNLEKLWIDNGQRIVGEDGKSISGGEHKRIAIARSLIRQPSILILDEPTSSLDIHNTNAIFDIIFSLKRSNRIIIVVTHEDNPNILEGFDQIVRLGG